MLLLGIDPDKRYFFAKERETIHKLPPSSYFSYFEKIEEDFEGNGEFYNVYFDCVEIKRIEQNYLAQNFAILPSQLLFCKMSAAQLKETTGVASINNLDGTWIKISTRQSQNQGISGQIDGVFIENLGIEIDFITPINDLPEDERAKYDNLRRVFDLHRYAKSFYEYDWNHVYNSLNNFHHVSIYNVGQGNLTALCKENNVPIVYFDMGGGFGRNRHTYLNTRRICPTELPPVILSHWDIDHFETALRSNQSHSLPWFVPDQPLGLTHFILAFNLFAQGNLYLLDNTITIGGLSIFKCTGLVKNDNGLALLLDYARRILLPGDASYRRIPHILGLQFDGLIASHHASNRELVYGGQNQIPLGNQVFNMLAFSYGFNNIYHNHNPGAVLADYRNKNWGVNMYLETPGGTIKMARNTGIFNVPCGDNFCDLNIIQEF